MFNISNLSLALIQNFIRILESENQSTIEEVLHENYPEIFDEDGNVIPGITDQDLYNFFLKQDNNRELNSSIVFEGCNNPYHAQAKAISELLKSRYQKVITLSIKNTGILYEPGDYLYLNPESIPQLKNTYLLLTEVSVNEDNTIDVSGLTFDPGLLSWNEVSQKALIGKKYIDFNVSPPTNLVFTETSVNQEYSSGSLSWTAPADNSAFEYLVLGSEGGNDRFILGTTRSTYLDFPIFKSKTLSFYVYSINSAGVKSTIAATLNNQSVQPVVLNNISVIAEPNSFIIKRSQLVGTTSPLNVSSAFSVSLGLTELTQSSLGTLPPKSWAFVTTAGNLPSDQGTYSFSNNLLNVYFNQDNSNLVANIELSIDIVVNPTDEALIYTNPKCSFYTKKINLSQVLDLSSDRVYSADLSLYRYSVANINNQLITAGSYDLVNRVFLSLPENWYPTAEEALENAVLPIDAEYGDLYRIDANVQTYYPVTIATSIQWQPSRLANTLASVREIPVYYRRGYNGDIPTTSPTGGSFTFPFGPLVLPIDTVNPLITWSANIPDGAGDLYQSTARFSRIGNNGLNTNTPTWSFPRRVFQNPMASRILVVYYRKGIDDPIPLNAPVGGDFLFPNGPITLPTDLNPEITWSEEIPTGLGSIYESRAYVENLSNDGLAQNTIIWSQPRKVVDGVILTSNLTLYKWSVLAPTITSGSSQYNWNTETHSDVSSSLLSEGWSLEFPKFQGQGDLWLARKQISVDAGTSISTVDWSSNVTIAKANPNDIPNSKNTTVTLYQWALSIPTITGTSFYKWLDGTLVDSGGLPVLPPTGWSINPITSPSAGFTLYSASVRLLDSFSAETTFIDWGQSIITTIGFAAEGVEGPPGEAGVQGASTRIAYGKSALAVNNDSDIVTTTGNISFPPSDSWDFTSVTWSSSVPLLSTNEYLWQTNGIYNPTTNQTFWESPFLATFKVGQLSAIATNTGSLNANEITVAADGFIKSGKEYYEDPDNPGFFIGKSGSVTKFEVGNEDGSKSIKWDGELLSINGSEIVVPRVLKTVTPLARFKPLKEDEFYSFTDHTGFKLSYSNLPFSDGITDPETGIKYIRGGNWPAYIETNGDVKSTWCLGVTSYNVIDLGFPGGYYPNDIGSNLYVAVVRREWFSFQWIENISLNQSLPYLVSNWSSLPKYTPGLIMDFRTPFIVPSTENGFAYILNNMTHSLTFELPSTEPIWPTTFGTSFSVTGPSGTRTFTAIQYPKLQLYNPIAPDSRFLSSQKQIPIFVGSSRPNYGFLPANYLCASSTSSYSFYSQTGNLKPYRYIITATTIPTLPVSGITFLPVPGSSSIAVYADDAIGTNKTFTYTSQQYVLYYNYMEGTGEPNISNVNGTWVFFSDSANSVRWSVYADDSVGTNQTYSYNNQSAKLPPVYDSLNIDDLTVEVNSTVDVVGVQGLAQTVFLPSNGNTTVAAGYTSPDLCIYYTPEPPSIYFSGWNPIEITEYIEDNIICRGSNSAPGPISLFGIKVEDPKLGFYSVGIMYFKPAGFSSSTGDYTGGTIIDGKVAGHVLDFINFPDLYSYTSRISEFSVLTTGLRE